MAWIKGKVGKNNKILEGYQPSHGPKKPIAPVGGSGVSDIEPTLEPQYWKDSKKLTSNEIITEGNYRTNMKFSSHDKNKPIKPPLGPKPVAKDGAILNEGFLPQKKMQLVLKEEGSMFPILIQYTDTKEYATCKQPSDINVGKRFKIIKTDFK